MKALVGAFNQEKALVGAFSVIVQPVVEPMDQFAALVITCNFPASQYLCSHNVETFHSRLCHDTVDTMLHVASRG